MGRQSPTEQGQGVGTQVSFECCWGVWNSKAEERPWKKNEFIQRRGVGKDLEIFPNIIHQLAPELEDPDPEAEPLLLRKMQFAFLPI